MFLDADMQLKGKRRSVAREIVCIYSTMSLERHQPEKLDQRSLRESIKRNVVPNTKLFGLIITPPS